MRVIFLVQAHHPFLLVYAKTLMLPRRERHLSRSALSLLQPYQPSLSAAWMFQRSMALKQGQLRQTRHTPAGRPSRQEGWVPPNQINRLLSCNFAVMQVGSSGGPICLLLIQSAYDRASRQPTPWHCRLLLCNLQCGM